MTQHVAGGSPAPDLSPHRRRRPVGEPPPLPRDLRGPTTLWIVAVVLLLVGYVWGKWGGPTGGQFQRWLDRHITSVVPNLSGGRLATTGRALASDVGLWLLIATRWGTAVALIVWKRWRHLAVFVGSVALVTVVSRWFPTAGTRPSTPNHPAYAAASLAVTVMGVCYGLVPAGRPRRRALWISGIVCGLLAL